jgi:hypothetical protein
MPVQFLHCSEISLNFKSSNKVTSINSSIPIQPCLPASLVQGCTSCLHRRVITIDIARILQEKNVRLPYTSACSSRECFPYHTYLNALQANVRPPVHIWMLFKRMFVFPYTPEWFSSERSPLVHAWMLFKRMFFLPFTPECSSSECSPPPPVQKLMIFKWMFASRTHLNALQANIAPPPPVHTWMLLKLMFALQYTPECRNMNVGAPLPYSVMLQQDAYVCIRL